MRTSIFSGTATWHVDIGHGMLDVWPMLDGRCRRQTYVFLVDVTYVRCTTYPCWMFERAYLKQFL
jgi:hypothetical protein